MATMNASISLEGLWSIIDSLSLKNKKWLAAKLNDAIVPAESVSEDAALRSIAQSLREVKEGKTQPIENLWSQL